MEPMNSAHSSSYRVANSYGAEVASLRWHDDGQVVEYVRTILRTELNAPLVITRLGRDGAYVEVARVD